MEFVLDCSVAISWYFADEKTERTDKLRDQLVDEVIIVPLLWSMEVCNVLAVACRRGRITGEEALKLLDDLKYLPDEVDNETEAMVWQYSFQLAQQHNLSVYDAVYLELAIRKKCPLATLDGRLKEACFAADVKVIPA